ncbi:disulfide bond formation protein DsbA [Salmonella enterica]|nr:disulfide bond formation protein DsbA [Salmonella enterica]EBS3610492.1 disulfide bond formation protein DsbA [Salmonella enterica subsp. enterica serovar Poona]EBV7178497.1 disulfide bond formation protein DsbA [Salmonella enterica subsp. enterica serovar Thompson]EBY7194459.1 disulfide bond formation protein DsbA [Salmonella enterica subsp. enterica serovar Birkenhead]ECD0769250.1 disulfide bond formation protein DsbA [Salmonella enterica subsp. enterica serovar Papuana]ECI8010682.1 disul
MCQLPGHFPNLEKAVALILAGMERHDRATTRKGNNNLS